MIEPTRAFRQRVEGGGEVEEHKGSEENWPHEQDMNENICWVAVISPIECKMPLQIKQSAPTHGNFCREFCLRIKREIQKKQWRKLIDGNGRDKQVGGELGFKGGMRLLD